jgi:type I restriction enzyme S subunit
MRTVLLQQICEIQIGKTPSRSVPEYWGGKLPWVTISDFAAGRTIETTKERITETGAEKSGSKLISQGTLLLSFKLSLGKRAYAGCDLFTNEAIAALSILDQDITDRDYLYWALASIDYDRLVDRAAKGKTLNKAKLKTIQIPLPPLSEQKRIAAILDAADALRAKRRESLAQLDTLLQCTFLDMFGDCGRPPISIGELTFGDPTRFVLLSGCARLATGHTPDREVLEYWGGDIPWVSLTDIRDLDGTIATTTGQNVTQRGIENSSAVTLPKGTVCFSRTASIGFVTVMGREMCTSQDFVNWVCGDELSPIYLMWALRLSRPYLLSKASGSTHKTIYYRHAEQFQVFLPPRDRQHRFATIVESVERQKARLRAHLAELDTLFASLQARAFNGEL